MNTLLSLLFNAYISEIIATYIMRQYLYLKWNKRASWSINVQILLHIELP